MNLEFFLHKNVQWYSFYREFEERESGHEVNFNNTFHHIGDVILKYQKMESKIERADSFWVQVISVVIVWIN
jgi:hypothetical protein